MCPKLLDFSFFSSFQPFVSEGKKCCRLKTLNVSALDYIIDSIYGVCCVIDRYLHVGIEGCLSPGLRDFFVRRYLLSVYMSVPYLDTANTDRASGQ